MTQGGKLYEFVFRGLLAEAALDAAGRPQRALPAEFDPSLATRLGLDSIDESYVQEARRMAVVYTAIAAFENAVRRFVETVLADKYGATWWEKGVSEKIRKFAESRRKEEEEVKWHGQRGASLLNYTEMGHLGDIIRNNYTLFEPFIPTIEWADAIFGTLERSRNVIMHSGQLGPQDIERVGMNIRDWVRQVGA